MKRLAKLIAVLCLAALFAFESESASAQVFGMKGGVTIGSVTTREVDSINPMLNYYFEAYYACRFQRYKYWTVGIGYFGTGATLFGLDEGNQIKYEATVRFNNFVVPVKIKLSAEGKRKPRPYAFLGAMPAVMYNEDKSVKLSMKDPEKHVPSGLNTDYIFKWTPNRLNLYALCGGGCYYRHFTLDFMFTVNALRDYKEIEAPISYNKSFIVTLGYQVSADRSKIW